MDDEVKDIIKELIALEKQNRELQKNVDFNQVFVSMVNKLPTCNECFVVNCKFRPRLGETVRYNCFMYAGGKK